MNFRAHAPAASVGGLLPVLALWVFIGCSGADLPPAISGVPPSTTPGAPEVELLLPPDGAELSAPATLSVVVTGGTVDRVTFQVDGVAVTTVDTPPYRWTIVPDSYGTGQHTLGLVVQYGDESISRSVAVQIVRPAPPPANAAETLAAMEALSAGHWLEIPNSHLENVKPVPLPAGVLGVRGVMDSWSGGAFDTKRERLIVWGGGHTGYSGNEIYVFDVPTVSWIRLTEPSAFPPGDPDNSSDLGSHPDGAPISRHSHNYIAYIPDPVDALFVGGGAAMWKTGQFEDPTTFLFNFGTRTWAKKSDCPVTNVGSFCAVDSDGLVWQHATQGSSKLANYDASKDEWTSYARPSTGLAYYYTAAYHAQLNWLVAVGQGRTLYWDLDSPGTAYQVLSTSGSSEIEIGQAPGLDYHANTNTLVAWVGGSAVYQLDCESAKWTKVSALNQVSPGPANTNGTYGRFRYMPKRDLFIVVNKVSENVFVYRIPSN